MGFLFIFRKNHGLSSPHQSELTQLFDSSRTPTAPEWNPELSRVVHQQEPRLRGSLEGLVYCRLCWLSRPQLIHSFSVSRVSETSWPSEGHRIWSVRCKYSPNHQSLATYWHFLSRRLKVNPIDLNTTDQWLYISYLNPQSYWIPHKRTPRHNKNQCLF